MQQLQAILARQRRRAQAFFRRRPIIVNQVSRDYIHAAIVKRRIGKRYPQSNAIPMAAVRVRMRRPSASSAYRLDVITPYPRHYYVEAGPEKIRKKSAYERRARGGPERIVHEGENGRPASGFHRFHAFSHLLYDRFRNKRAGVEIAMISQTAQRRLDQIMAERGFTQVIVQ